MYWKNNSGVPLHKDARGKMASGRRVYSPEKGNKKIIQLIKLKINTFIHQVFEDYMIKITIVHSMTL